MSIGLHIVESTKNLSASHTSVAEEISRRMDAEEINSTVILGPRLDPDEQVDFEAVFITGHNPSTDEHISWVVGSNPPKDDVMNALRESIQSIPVVLNFGTLSSDELVQLRRHVTSQIVGTQEDHDIHPLGLIMVTRELRNQQLVVTLWTLGPQSEMREVGSLIRTMAELRLT